MQIIQLIEQTDAEVLIQMYYDDPILSIDFVYDPIELELKREEIEKHFRDYLNSLKE